MSLILFAHGARDPRWRLPFEALRDAMAKRMPKRRVCLAFLELMSPSLSEAVAAEVALGVTHLDIAPVFLAAGTHLRQDLPAMMAEIAQQCPTLSVKVLPVLGELAPVQEAIADAYDALLKAG